MSRKITAEKVDRLEKFFRLMGSDQDGEAISALRMTRHLITDLDMTWNEFVTLLARYLFGFQSHGVEAKAQPERSSDVWGFEDADIDEMLNRAFQDEKRRREQRENQSSYAENMRQHFFKKDSLKPEGYDEAVFRSTGMDPDEWAARGFHDPDPKKQPPEVEKKENLQDFLRRVKREVDAAASQQQSTTWFKGANFEQKDEEKKDG